MKTFIKNLVLYLKKLKIKDCYPPPTPNCFIKKRFIAHDLDIQGDSKKWENFKNCYKNN